MTQAADDDEAIIIIISEKIQGMERLEKHVEALLTKEKSPIAAWETWMGAKLEQSIQTCGTSAGTRPTRSSGPGRLTPMRSTSGNAAAALSASSA